MKRLKSLFVLSLAFTLATPVAVYAVDLGGSDAIDASTEVIINPDGGNAPGDGLFIAFDRGSFVVWRDNQYQNYLQSPTPWNGLILSVTDDTGTAVWGSPRDGVYNVNSEYLLGGSFFGAGVHNRVTGSQESGYQAETVIYTGFDDNYDPATEWKIRMVLDYQHPNEFFEVTYELTAPIGNTAEVDLYHHVDMYLDGSDEGPGEYGALDNEFQGNYIVQSNPETGGVGGFIESDHEFSSFFAGEYWETSAAIADDNSFLSPTRGAPFGEPLPSTFTTDAGVDVGVAIHFDMGAPTGGTTVTRSSYVLFATEIPTDQKPTPTEPMHIVSIGPKNVNSSSETRIIRGRAVPTITRIEVGGIVVPFRVLTDESMEIVLNNLPEGLHDLVVFSSRGQLRWQDAYLVSQEPPKYWTVFSEDTNEVRIYAKNIVGEGKVQFFVDGEEIAYVDAVSGDDPKLISNQFGTYLVRTVIAESLVKNRYEIKVDGERVFRSTYVPDN